MKSLLMAVNLLSVSLGNLFTALVNWYFKTPSGESTLVGANYYWFFCGVMLATAVAFIFFARTFRERTYIQQERPASRRGFYVLAQSAARRQLFRFPFGVPVCRVLASPVLFQSPSL